MSDAVPCCRIPKHSLLLGVISSPQKRGGLDTEECPSLELTITNQKLQVSALHEMTPVMGSYHLQSLPAGSP